jgi:hypothetical protein
MSEVIRQTVTARTPNSVVTKDKEVMNDSTPQTISYIIYFLFGILEVLLFFRFVFRLTGANPNSGFVSFIYSITRIFAMPFSGIFPTATTQGAIATAVFEPSTLIAIAVYAVLAWGIVRLVAILSRQSQEIE